MGLQRDARRLSGPRQVSVGVSTAIVSKIDGAQRVGSPKGFSDIPRVGPPSALHPFCAEQPRYREMTLLQQPWRSSASCP
eukprot:8128962-Alexandrium_andersonii.AAC.1